MEMSNHLNVLYTSDNKYAPFMGVSIFSLLENNKDIGEITIYAMINGFSDDNLCRLNNLVKEYQREIVIIEAAELDEMLDEYGVPKYRGGHAPNYRMFFERYVSEQVERLLYLDSDTIVTGSLKPLLNLNMEGKVFGGVLGPFAYKYKQKFGIAKDEPYVNSGVLLFDAAKWREDKCQEVLVNHMKNVRPDYYNPDQDLLNVVFNGRILKMPLQYNMYPFHYAYTYKTYYKYYGNDYYYKEEEIREAVSNPVILHTFRFLGEFPWHKGNLHPNRKIYDEYLYRSPWKDYVKKKSDKNTAVFKIEKLMYIFLPKDVFLKIFVKMRKNPKIKKLFR